MREREGKKARERKTKIESEREREREREKSERDRDREQEKCDVALDSEFLAALVPSRRSHQTAQRQQIFVKRQQILALLHLG